MIAHVLTQSPERVIRESQLGSTKPTSSEQLRKLAIGRRRAAMAGRPARADKLLRRF